MGYIIAAYFALFFILRKLVNGVNRVVEKNGKLYELVTGGNHGRCTYGKNSFCGFDRRKICTRCYMKSEISQGRFIFGRVVLGLYSAVILIGGVVFISMMSI